MTWILTLCIGVSWGGCGSWQEREFPDADSCYRSLKEMRTGDQPISESDKKRNTVAFCAPKQKSAK